MATFSDITGQKFNHWTVLELIKKGTSAGPSKWKCQCDCGEISIVGARDLKSGRSSKCRKCNGKQSSLRQCHDLTGRKFGKWIVINRAGTGKNRNALWNCRCLCGHFKMVQSGTLLNNTSTCCGKCNQFEGIKAGVWNNIVRGAKRRNLLFTITVKDIWKLWLKQESKCALSGILLSLPEKTRDKYTASLDRIDPSKGYIEGNIQWIHKDINCMKWSLTADEFIQICQIVANNNIKESKDCYLNNYSVHDKLKDRKKSSRKLTNTL